MKQKWKILKSEKLVSTPFTTLRQDQLELPDGRVMPKYFVMEFTDWVNIVAITPDQKLVMVEQYRHGWGDYTLEIPGGASNPHEDKDMLAAGLRELLEETGYSSQRAEVIAKHTPNPALQSNHVYTVLVQDCVKVAEPHLDPFEDIEVKLIDLREIPALISSGKIHHSIVLASLLAANSKIKIF